MWCSKQVPAIPSDGVILYPNMHGALSKYLPPNVMVSPFMSTCMMVSAALPYLARHSLHDGVKAPLWGIQISGHAGTHYLLLDKENNNRWQNAARFVSTLPTPANPCMHCKHTRAYTTHIKSCNKIHQLCEHWSYELQNKQKDTENTTNEW